MHKNTNVYIFKIGDNKIKLYFREAANCRYLLRLETYNSLYTKCISKMTCDFRGKEIAFDDSKIETSVNIDVAMSVLKRWKDTGKITDDAFKWATYKDYPIRELYK